MPYYLWKPGLRQIYSKAFCLWGNHASVLFLYFILIWWMSAATNPLEHSMRGYHQVYPGSSMGILRENVYIAKYLIDTCGLQPNLKALSTATSAGNLKKTKKQHFGTSLYFMLSVSGFLCFGPKWFGQFKEWLPSTARHSMFFPPCR